MYPREIKRFRGFTLLEVVVTILVISISATALIGIYSGVVSRSADPVIQQQAIAIAEAYLEEIQLQSYADPDGVETGGSEEGANRGQFDDAQDYNDASVDGAVEDQNGVAVTQLTDYAVTVTVGFATLDSISQASNDALRIDVTVNHPAIDSITLSGFRTNY